MQTPHRLSWVGCFECVVRDLSVFGRPGSDLLSQALRPSIIGAKGFNGRVRDGIGFFDPCNNHRIGEKPLLFEIDADEAWDIDEELDFTITDFLLRRKNQIESF